MGSYIEVSEEFKEKAWKELEDYPFFRYLDKCLHNGNFQAIFELLSFNVRARFANDELKKLLIEGNFKKIETNLDASNEEDLRLSQKCLGLLQELEAQIKENM